MAYNTKKLKEMAIESIDKHKLFFIEDVITYLPCSKPCFYDHFPVDSNDFNELNDKLHINRMNVKVSLRNKWYKSENATLQMALMKLIVNDDERRRLSTTFMETKQHHVTPDLSNFTTEEIKELLRSDE
jgi:hypothetical protein